MSVVRCIHFTVSGRVQGVYFRASTQEQAQQLGLVGWIRNTDDGDVEGVAQGDSNDLDLLVEWLHLGPPQANVEQVKVNTIAAGKFQEFEVQH
jgi:acylphosphatase